jgi:organic hydroperoxide reductase OsmC/OhrA
MSVRPKYPEKIVYTSQAEWDGKTGGIATVSDGRTIVFDTPKMYGGNGEGVCPDEMFVSSVIGCLTNTFLDFKRKTLLEVDAFHLKGQATAEFDKEGYHITGIRIEGEVVVDPDDFQFAERAIEMMKKYCHLTRSIKRCIPMEYDISIRGTTG